MNRIGCPTCGDIIESKHHHDFITCGCGGVSADGGEAYHKRSFRDCPPVELPTVADVLAFKLRMQGRGGEATRVEDDVAILEEHRPGARP